MRKSEPNLSARGKADGDSIFDPRQSRYQTASIPVNFDPSQQTATHINEALAEAKSPLVGVSRNRRTVGRYLGIYPSNGCAYNHKACP